MLQEILVSKLKLLLTHSSFSLTCLIKYTSVSIFKWRGQEWVSSLFVYTRTDYFNRDEDV